MSTIAPDFTLAGGGTLYVLSPVSDEARDWLGEHVDSPDSSTWCGGQAIGHRYIEAIVKGILDAGLSIEEVS